MLRIVRQPRYAVHLFAYLMVAALAAIGAPEVTPAVTAGAPAVAVAASGVIAGAPAVAAGAPAVTAGAPAVAAGASAVTAGAPAVAAGACVVTAGAPAVAAGASVVTAGAPAVAAGASVVTTGAPAVPASVVIAGAPGATTGAPAAAAAAASGAATHAEPPWMPVHPERAARLAGLPIYGVCFAGTVPRPRVTTAVELPASSPYRKHGSVLLAHCLIDDEGFVVKAQLIKVDAPADRLAAVRALANDRFAPAVYAGRPVAVHFMIRLPVSASPPP
jgi:hypothetical protein